MTALNTEFQPIRKAVQYNCHIADANQAADYTLCVYLLKMREYFRWEQGSGFNQPLPQESVGNWLREREQLWGELEGTEFGNLPVNAFNFDPFDNDMINQQLNPHGLVYSAGLGYKKHPHFFLGRLERHDTYQGFQLYVTAEEYARDLTSPPAMSLGNTIFLRRESIKRMLWEKVETWNWNKPDNAMGYALACYPFDTDIDKALNAMTENELESILLHEIGEVQAGELLGTQWETLLMQVATSKAELLLRSVRDHLADSLSTLPRIIELENNNALHFYIGNLSHLRKNLYPALVEAYEQWRHTGKLEPLLDLVEQGKSHWLSVAQQALDMFKPEPDQSGRDPSSQPKYLSNAIVDLVEAHTL